MTASSRGSSMKTYVILLRGVMPTGKNKVPMAALRLALTEAGLARAQTYIQSGNVVAASNLSQGKIEQLVHEVIKKKIGADISVIARTAEHFRDILKRNPFAANDTPKTYFTILAAPPSAERAHNLLSLDFSPDRIKMVDDTIYTLYATRYSDSKFNNNFFETRLKARATTRNFNTMSKLAELAS